MGWITEKPHSELRIFDPDPWRSRGEVKERVEQKMCCQHCGVQVTIPKHGLHDVGDLCRNCWKFICAACVKRGTCNPLEKALEYSERTGQPFNPYRLPE